MGEKRVTVRNLDWQAYQQLRSLLEHRTHARLTYDRGTLEITMSLEEHEIAAESDLELGLDRNSLSRNPSSESN